MECVSAGCSGKTLRSIVNKWGTYCVVMSWIFSLTNVLYVAQSAELIVRPVKSCLRVCVCVLTRGPIFKKIVGKILSLA